VKRRIDHHALLTRRTRKRSEEHEGNLKILLTGCHCEERSDEAISFFFRRGRLLRSLWSLAMTPVYPFFNIL
jgi:hypothetical protein